MGCSANFEGNFHAQAAPVAGLDLRRAIHSSKRWNITKKQGTNTTARQVEASIPVETDIPIDLRALAPAPVASTSGKHPKDEREGRHQDRPQPRTSRTDRRVHDGSAMQQSLLPRNLDDQDRVLGAQRDQQHQPDLGIQVVVHPERRQRQNRPK